MNAKRARHGVVSRFVNTGRVIRVAMTTGELRSYSPVAMTTGELPQKETQVFLLAVNTRSCVRHAGILVGIGGLGRRMAAVRPAVVGGPAAATAEASV